MIEKKVEIIFAKLKAENLSEIVKKITQFKNIVPKIFQVKYILKSLPRNIMVNFKSS